MLDCCEVGGGDPLRTIRSGGDLQAHIDSLAAAGLGGLIQLPSGELTLTTPITIANATGNEIRGATMHGGTKLVWAGSATDIFRFMGTLNCGLSDLYVKVNSVADTLARISDNGPGGTRSSGFFARHMFVDGGPGLVETVFYVARTADGAKNDHHTFDTVQ